MSKDKVIEKLRKDGFNAQNIDGVVIVFYTDKNTLQDFIRTVKERLKEYGYEASWGCRYQSDVQGKFSEVNE